MEVLMFKQALIATILLTSFYSNAIVPIKNDFEVKEGFSGDVLFNFEKRDGTTEKSEYAINTNLSYRYKNNIFNFSANNNYGKTNDTKSVDEEFYHIRYIINDFYNQYNLEFFIQNEKDEFKDLSNRNLFGTGLSQISRKQNFMNGEFQMSYFGGVMFESEKSISNSELNDDTVRLSISTTIKYTLKNKTEFYVDAYYQPSVSDFSDVRGIVNTGLQTPIIDDLFLGLNYQYQYDSEPFANVSRQNKILSTYIKYQW
jgi:hypothetical protein